MLKEFNDLLKLGFQHLTPQLLVSSGTVFSRPVDWIQHHSAGVNGISCHLPLIDRDSAVRWKLWKYSWNRMTCYHLFGWVKFVLGGFDIRPCKNRTCSRP